MTFSWRRRRGGAGKSEASILLNQDMELTIPSHFKCPISLDLMKDPVTLSTGITYDRQSIEKWIDGGKVTCPVTNQVLRNFDQIPNHSIRKMIQDWCVANKSHGVERIPTPRIPISRYEVSEICSRMEAATMDRDARKCLELLAKIKNSAKESEVNKRCIVANGVGSALSDSFESFARFSVDENVSLLKEILSALTWAFPVDREGVSKLKTAVSLRCMAWFLKSEDDLSSRQNAICVLKDLVSADQGCVDGLMGIEGIEEALFQIVKVPICPRATKASLVVIHYIISSTEKSEETGLRFVQMGLIPLILEVLVDGDKSACEKALGVMESICSWKQGRESALSNALTVPLLVKKILRVSDAATDFSISTLWKLCLGQNENALVEAVQLGAFQKLLVVLQIGSGGEGTKERVTDLLKLMNLYRDKLDCFDSSMGFKYIKRPN
ncbi:hypothetical protein C2S53_009025 [Perilla frutescens var. hirtella]|uniref:U-box domain-containing protein n=1 Tax=Perilla frutescens var. hirtella TaxID=608512 RepID=A0AAD4P0L3_PERFH|nr:hypothetical protein C2S53_009025 [Perilla frutescens var. hirtella]